MNRSRCWEVAGGSICFVTAIILIIVSGKQDPYKN